MVKRDEANKLKRKSLDSKTSNPKPAKITKDQNQPKMCKIQFQDNESSSEEEFADPSTISTCSRVLPISSKSVKIKFRLDSDTENESEEIEDDDLQRKLCEIFGNPEVEEDSQSSSASSSNFIIEKSPTRKVMKIHYQDYYKRILTSEMKSLMHQSYLNDVEFVCKDGSIFCNSLILGSMSNYLYNILADVPIVDKVKIVIMPDISSVDLNALFKCLFNNEIRQISVKDMKRIKSIASLFKLESIFDISRKPGRPKGSLNKPKIVTKSSSVEQPLIESQPRKVQFTSDHSEDSLRESVDSECLEILSATSSNQPQNTSQLMTHHHNQNQEKMNLLPSNDLLDQIVQDTTRTNNSGNT